MTEIRVFPDPASLAQAVAEEFLEIAGNAIEVKGSCVILLAGGSTPKSAYSLLAERHRDWYGWERMVFCWGDERCVAPDHIDSNYRMAYESLLSQVPARAENIYRMPGELDPPDGAERYGQVLKEIFKYEGVPRFDLVLLGMGEDGHTASLFPGSPAVDETERWVVAVAHQELPPPLISRLSVTFPLINAARNVLLLVAGANKASILAKVLRPDSDSLAHYPVQRVRPQPGFLTWMIDAAAAQLLTT